MDSWKRQNAKNIMLYSNIFLFVSDFFLSYLFGAILLYISKLSWYWYSHMQTFLYQTSGVYLELLFSYQSFDISCQYIQNLGNMEEFRETSLLYCCMRVGVDVRDIILILFPLLATYLNYQIRKIGFLLKVYQFSEWIKLTYLLVMWKVLLQKKNYVSRHILVRLVKLDSIWYYHLPGVVLSLFMENVIFYI